MNKCTFCDNPSSSSVVLVIDSMPFDKSAELEVCMLCKVSIEFCGTVSKELVAELDSTIEVLELAEFEDMESKRELPLICK